MDKYYAIMYYIVTNLLTLPGVPLCPALYSGLVCTSDVTGYVSWHGVNGMEDVSIFVSFIPEKMSCFDAI